MSLPSLDRVDPARAWQPWQPDDNQPWSLRWAGHLYRRAAFGGTLAELRQAVKAGPQATIDRLLAGEPEAKNYESMLAETGVSIAKTEDEAALRGWWLYAMLNSGHCAAGKDDSVLAQPFRDQHCQGPQHGSDARSKPDAPEIRPRQLPVHAGRYQPRPRHARLARFQSQRQGPGE